MAQDDTYAAYNRACELHGQETAWKKHEEREDNINEMLNKFKNSTATNCYQHPPAYPQGVCPHCGHCPYCGRGGHYHPYFPYTWITYTNS